MDKSSMNKKMIYREYINGVKTICEICVSNKHTKEGFHVRVYNIVNVVRITYFHLGLLRVINLELFHGKSTSTMTSIETLNSHVQKTSNEYDIFHNHEMLHDLFACIIWR